MLRFISTSGERQLKNYEFLIQNNNKEENAGEFSLFSSCFKQIFVVMLGLLTNTNYKLIVIQWVTPK